MRLAKFISYCRVYQFSTGSSTGGRTQKAGPVQVRFRPDMPIRFMRQSSMHSKAFSESLSKLWQSISLGSYASCEVLIARGLQTN